LAPLEIVGMPDLDSRSREKCSVGNLPAFVLKKYCAGDALEDIHVARTIVVRIAATPKVRTCVKEAKMYSQFC
jgi:hypothetical protein